MVKYNNGLKMSEKPANVQSKTLKHLENYCSGPMEKLQQILAPQRQNIMNWGVTQDLFHNIVFCCLLSN